VGHAVKSFPEIYVDSVRAITTVYDGSYGIQVVDQLQLTRLPSLKAKLGTVQETVFFRKRD
jgi:hypothetical protein